jgi:DNA repair ATPase RecN
VILGFKTRHILSKHQLVNKYRTDYQDMLAWAFKLQVELSQLNDKKKTEQAAQVKRLLLQSVRDLTQKRAQFNQTFDEII